MSALMEQHERWTAARERMAMPYTPIVRVRRPAAIVAPVATVPVRKRREPMWGVPVNLLGLASHKVILKLVAVRHGISVDEITSRNRCLPVMRARHEAIALIYTHCRHLSLPQIGLIFGKDHTTILHSLRTTRANPPPYMRAPYRTGAQ